MRQLFRYLVHITFAAQLVLISSMAPARALPDDDWVLICSLIYRPSPSTSGSPATFETTVRERRMLECASRRVPGSGEGPAPTGDPNVPKGAGGGGGGGGAPDPSTMSCDRLKAYEASLASALAQNIVATSSATTALDVINQTLRTLISVENEVQQGLNRTQAQCEEDEFNLQAFVNLKSVDFCRNHRGADYMDCLDAILLEPGAQSLVKAQEEACTAYSLASSRYSTWRTSRATADREAASLRLDLGKLRVQAANLRKQRAQVQSQLRSRCRPFE